MLLLEKSTNYRTVDKDFASATEDALVIQIPDQGARNEQRSTNEGSLKKNPQRLLGSLCRRRCDVADPEKRTRAEGLGHIALPLGVQ